MDQDSSDMDPFLLKDGRAKNKTPFCCICLGLSNVVAMENGRAVTVIFLYQKTRARV